MALPRGARPSFITAHLVGANLTPNIQPQPSDAQGAAV